MNRNLRLLWIGDSASFFGAAIYVLALSLLALYYSNSTLGAGLVLFSSTLPYFFLGIIGGVIADRVNRKMLMVTSDLARAALTLSIPLAFQWHKLTIEQIVIVGFLITCFRAFSFPAAQASVPQLVDNREQLNKVNSYMGSTRNLGTMMGPSLGGVLLIFNLSVPVLLYINTATYLISACCNMMITFPKPEGHEKRRSILHEAWQGIKYMVVGNKRVAVMLLAFACTLFVGAGITQLGLPKLLEEHHLNSARSFGFMLSAIALATALSSLAMAHFKVVRVERWVFAGYLLRGVSYLIFMLVPGVIGLVLAVLFLGCGQAIGGNALTTLLQTSTPNEMLGKVMAVRSSIGNIADTIAYVLIGGLLTLVSLSTTFVIVGAYVIAATLLCWKWWSYEGRVQHVSQRPDVHIPN